MEKTISIQIVGAEQVIDSALDAFVRQHGWTDTINGEPNPVSKTDMARSVLMKFITETVSAYTSEQAAKAAREQAAVQTADALRTAAMSLELR